MTKPFVTTIGGPQDLKPVDALVKPWAKADPESAELLGQVRMHVWRGATATLLMSQDQQPLCLVVGKLLVRPRGEWGRYYNLLVMYTPPESRGRGHLQTLFPYATEGADRLKSMAGSFSGVVTYLRMGFRFWGETPKGELVVDEPLTAHRPAGTPYYPATLLKPVPRRPLSLPEVTRFVHRRYGRDLYV